MFQFFFFFTNHSICKSQCVFYMNPIIFDQIYYSSRQNLDLNASCAQKKYEGNKAIRLRNIFI